MFCPNCGATDVEGGAASCHACHADFSAAGGWRPVADPAESASASDTGGGGVAVSVLNSLLATAAILILAIAVYLPTMVGGKAGNAANERWWAIAALVALMLSVFVVVKRVGLSILILLFACCFFFVSCSANFHWKGG